MDGSLVLLELGVDAPAVVVRRLAVTMRSSVEPWLPNS